MNRYYLVYILWKIIDEQVIIGYGLCAIATCFATSWMDYASFLTIMIHSIRVITFGNLYFVKPLIIHPINPPPYSLFLTLVPALFMSP